MNDPQAFWLEARYQGVCAVCGRANGRPDSRGRTWHPHHVVSRHRLKRLRLPEFDPRNALRLCTDCHMSFEWAGPGKTEVPITTWTQQNVCFVFETLGVTAVQLERKYGELDIDPRWTAHLREECAECQLQSSPQISV